MAGQKRLHQVGIRLTDAEDATLAALVLHLGVNESEVFRRALQAFADVTLATISNDQQTKETTP